MLTDQQRILRELIAEAVGRVGRSATKIADDVLPRAFRRSLPELEIEGGARILRQGLVAFIKPLLDEAEPDDRQLDFGDVDEAFHAIVSRLPKRVFFVPSLGLYVPISDLIDEPERLDEARRFTRQKGEETLATADILDQLYAAVIDAR